jgi:hypothetical protein
MDAKVRIHDYFTKIHSVLLYHSNMHCTMHLHIYKRNNKNDVFFYLPENVFFLNFFSINSVLYFFNVE